MPFVFMSADKEDIPAAKNGAWILETSSAAFVCWLGSADLIATMDGTHLGR